MRALDIGDVLDDRYEIFGILGQGGMGSVYKARQIKLDRIVALKVPNASMLADSGFMRRFEREARTCARFTHDNIVTIHDVMVSKDIAYICMEYVDGDPLDKFLTLHFDELAVADAVDLIGQICQGLHRAHEEEIIHRDIKPSNIYVTRDKRRVKIMDFGIARVAEATALTVDGSIMGTPYYMSPEQIRGETVTPATDVYSLAVVIYQIFTNRLVFEGEITALIFKHVSEAPPPPRQINPHLPEPLSACLLKGLEKEPPRRYQSTLDLFDDLREATAAIAHLPLCEIVASPAKATMILQEPPVAAKPPTPHPAIERKTPIQKPIPQPTPATAEAPTFHRERTRTPVSAATATTAMPGDKKQRATLSEAATIVGMAPEVPPLPGERRPATAPNLGLLALKAILRGLGHGFLGLVRGLARSPRWAKAVILAVAVLAIAYCFIPWNGGLLSESSTVDLPKVGDQTTAGPATPPRAVGPTVTPATAVGVPAEKSQEAQPVAAAMPRKPSLGQRIRGWFGGGSKKSVLQMEVRFTQAPPEGQVGKLYRIEWQSRIVSGRGVVENYLVSLDGGKPFRVSARRPFFSSDSLPAGKHRLTVQAESRDDQRSAPAEREFEIR